MFSTAKLVTKVKWKISDTKNAVKISIFRCHISESTLHVNGTLLQNVILFYILK
jgi:hypothetical protein